MMSNIFDDANLENIAYVPGSHLSIIDALERWITVLTYGLGDRGIIEQWGQLEYSTPSGRTSLCEPGPCY